MIAMNSTTMRHLYVRVLLLGIWFVATMIVAGTLARSNVEPHSAYPSAGRGFLSP